MARTHLTSVLVCKLKNVLKEIDKTFKTLNYGNSGLCNPITLHEFSKSIYFALIGDTAALENSILFFLRIFLLDAYSVYENWNFFNANVALELLSGFDAILGFNNDKILKINLINDLLTGQRYETDTELVDLLRVSMLAIENFNENCKNDLANSIDGFSKSRIGSMR